MPPPPDHEEAPQTLAGERNEDLRAAINVTPDIDRKQVDDLIGEVKS